MEDNTIQIYKSEDGMIHLDVKVDKDTVWLTQRQIADLFGCSIDNAGLHLKNIYKEEELTEKATTEESSVVQVEGKRKVKRTVILYNFDAILSVGYRVSSKRATRFRQWASEVIKAHVFKGYTLNQDKFTNLANSFNMIKESWEFMRYWLNKNLSNLARRDVMVEIDNKVDSVIEDLKRLKIELKNKRFIE